jgi:hypothetical protein
MAATRVEPSVLEIFTTMEYGPVLENHACALVRACRGHRRLSSPDLPAAFCARTPVILHGSSATPPLSATAIPATS